MISSMAAKNLMFQTALVRNKNYKKHKGKYFIHSTEDFYRLVSSMSRWATEHAVVVLLVKHEVVGIHLTGIGGPGNVEVAPESTLASAMLTGADAVCFAHNHPNADAAPSKPDYFMAASMKEMLTCINVKLAEVIVVAGDEYTDLMPMIPFYETLLHVSRQMKGQQP